MTYLQRTFSALGNRNYRIYALGQGVSVSGTWMQKVAQALLVLELTDSAVLLGVTAAVQQLPTLLLTAWGGLLADRIDKRMILIVTQGLAAAPAVVLGILTATDRATLGLVLVLAGMLGCIEAIDKPARLTFVNDLVERRDLTNAVTLNNIIQNAAKVVGPAAGGLLIAAFGLASSFLINAASFLAVLVALAFIRIDVVKTRPPRARAHVEILSGLRYVRANPDLFGTLLLMTATGLVAFNWTVLLPLLARDTFDAGPTEVGLTFTAMGAGAVIGGLALAGVLRATRRMLAVWALCFAVAMEAIAMSPSLEVALGMLFLLGSCSVMFRTVGSSLLQLQAEPEMRGRVISLFVIATSGTTPVGSVLIGWVCEAYGVRTAFALAGLCTGLTALWATRYMRRAAAVVFEATRAQPGSCQPLHP